MNLTSLVCRKAFQGYVLALASAVLIFETATAWAARNVIELRSDTAGTQYFNCRLRYAPEMPSENYYLESNNPDVWAGGTVVVSGKTLPNSVLWAVEAKYASGDGYTTSTITHHPLLEDRNIRRDMYLTPVMSQACTRNTSNCRLSYTYGNHQQDWDFLVSEKNAILSAAGLSDSSPVWDKVMAMARHVVEVRKRPVEPEGDGYWLHPVDFLKHQGFCAGAGNTLTALCSVMGIPARTINWWNHTVNEVYINGKWRFVENTWYRLDDIPPNLEQGPVFTYCLADMVADPIAHGFYSGYYIDEIGGWESRVTYNLDSYTNWACWTGGTGPLPAIFMTMTSASELSALYPGEPVTYKCRQDPPVMLLTPACGRSSVKGYAGKQIMQGKGIRQAFDVSDFSGLTQVKSRLVFNTTSHNIPSNGGDWYYSVNGNKYYLRDNGGWTLSGQELVFTIPLSALNSSPSDTTPPSAPGVVRDGTGASDTDSVASGTTQLSANWTAATDAQSGISGYQYAIGTSAGGTQTLNWTTIGDVTAVTKTALSLVNGTTYYFSVKAVNGSGLAGTAANSDGQCVQRTGAVTVFSTQVYLGDSENYTPKTGARWSVSDEGGDLRYFLNTSAFTNDGDKVGEYSLITNRNYSDFTMTVKAKTAESLSANTQADYAVVFCFQDADNYYYVMANAAVTASQLFIVQNGVRTSLGTSATGLVPDTLWHTLEIKKTGASITVKLDGAVKIGPVSNSAYTGGQAGVGSYNDSAYFDDIKIEVGQQDTTAPLPPSTVRDGTAADIGSTASVTQLSANWTAGSDPESSISGYQYAIGSSPAGTDVAGWASIGNVLGFTRSGMSLVIGTTYYFGVKSVNEAGLISAAVYSDGQVVLSTSAPDTTAPVGPSTVYDGLTSGVDSAKTQSQTTLSANWTAATDAQSGISGYRYAIGTSAGGTQILNWTNCGTGRSVTRTGLTLTVGTTYYFGVKAVNGQGLEGSAVNSSGQYVESTADTTPPDLIADVRDGTGAEDSDVVILSVSASLPGELSANWDASADDESGIEMYWYAVGTTAGGSDIAEWTTNGNLTAVTHDGLSLAEGVEYYFSVKAQNGAGLESGISVSDGLYISRQSGGNLEINGVQSSAGANSVTIAWNTNNPATSQVEYGTTQLYGMMIIEDSSLVTAHSVVITGLLPGTQYHFRVISEDSGGGSDMSADYTFATSAAPGANDEVGAYPNPVSFANGGKITFKVGSGAAWYGVKIFTLSGKIVRTLAGTGAGEISWDGKNKDGEKVARGIYIYKIIQSGGDTVTGKLAVTR